MASSQTGLVQVAIRRVGEETHVETKIWFVGAKSEDGKNKTRSANGEYPADMYKRKRRFDFSCERKVRIACVRLAARRSETGGTYRQEDAK